MRLSLAVEPLGFLPQPGAVVGMGDSNQFLVALAQRFPLQLRPANLSTSPVSL